MVKLDSLIAVIVTLSGVRASAEQTPACSHAGKCQLITIKRPFRVSPLSIRTCTHTHATPRHATEMVGRTHAPAADRRTTGRRLAETAAGWPTHATHTHTRHMRVFVVTYARAPIRMIIIMRSVRSLYGRSPRAISSEDNNSIRRRMHAPRRWKCVAYALVLSVRM